MRLLKSLILLLVLVMVSEPVLASVCAAKCASHNHSQGQANVVNSMAGMADCHGLLAKQGHDQKQDSVQQSHDGQNQFGHSKHSQHAPQQHKACAMGAFCGFGQIASFSAISKLVLAESSRLVFPKFTPAEKSVDLSPPLKPPA